MLLFTQSGFRVSHSNETALLKLYNDLILAADNGKFSILLCLNFTAAFDTVDYSLLLNVLEKSFGVTGSCLSWFDSYIFLQGHLVCLLNLLNPQLFLLTLVYLRALFLVFCYLFFILLNSLRSSLPFLLIANCMPMILIFTLPTLILL